MAPPKRIADLSYKLFSGSMMLLTLYGGYLCSVRAYRFFQQKDKLREAAESQTEAVIKD
ncbi:hypothetical protein FKM82_009537 [Ascaphus truei]|uniref:cytochrome c oxidase assembly protein COX14 n=1 Tax=Ascaphus truei TaxID=8439 RepID=UPI003F59B1AF